MEQWGPQHRAFIVATFFKNGESVTVTQRKFRLHFNVARHGRIPSRNTILLWVHNFRTTASATKKKQGGSARTVRTPENVEAVRNAVEQSPRRSAVRHAQALRLSDTTVRRILHQDLNFHPYKLMLVQKLNQQDFGRRTTFAETMLQMFEEDPELVILTSDEAHFHLNGSVNKQNFRYWSTINPRQVHEHPLHCDRVTVWAAVAKFGVIGPYFFEENGRSVTVNSARYVVMIRNFLIPELRRCRLNQFRIWFQQDGATAHTSREALAELRRLFPGKLISHRGDVPWPPCSPDLSPCNFFL